MARKYYLGIDLGGTNIKTGVVDDDAKLLSKYSTPTCVEGNHSDTILKRMGQAGEIVIEQAGITVDDIAAIGVGSPGVLNHKEGFILAQPNIQGWKTSPFETSSADISKINSPPSKTTLTSPPGANFGPVSAREPILSSCSHSERASAAESSTAGDSSEATATMPPNLDISSSNPAADAAIVDNWAASKLTPLPQTPLKSPPNKYVPGVPPP